MMSFNFKTLTAAAALCVSGMAAQANVIPFDVLVTSNFNVTTGTNVSDYVGTTGSGTYDSGSLPDPIKGGNWFTPFGDEFVLTLDFASGSETFNSDDDIFGGALVEYSVSAGILDALFDVADDDITTPGVENNIKAPNIVDFSVIGVVPAFGQSLAQLQIEVQTASPIPLPASVLLMLGGLGAFGVMRKSRKATA